MNIRFYLGSGTQRKWFEKLIAGTILGSGQFDRKNKYLTFAVEMVNDPILDQIHRALDRYSFIDVLEVTIKDRVKATAYLSNDGEYDVETEHGKATVVADHLSNEGPLADVLIRADNLLTALETYKRYRANQLDEPVRSWQNTSY